MLFIGLSHVDLSVLTEGVGLQSAVEYMDLHDFGLQSFTDLLVVDLVVTDRSPR